MTCTDSYGDGWHGGYLEISGNQYCSQFSTGTEWIESMPNNQFVPEPGKSISNKYVVAKIIFCPELYNFYFDTEKIDFLAVICTDIKIVTEYWGSEISWTFGNCTSNQVYEDSQIYTEECCQLEGDYRLLCKDSYGDGWNGGYLEIDGTQYCTNSDFGSGHEHEIIDVAMPGINVFEYAIRNIIIL